LSSLHLLIATGHALVLASATTTTAKKTTSSALSYLPLILLIAVGGYLLFIRPRNQAARRQQQQGQQLSVGDRVLTRAGIVGRVSGFSGDRVQLEIADGVVIEIVRQGVGQKLPDQLDDEELIPPPPGAEHDEDDGDVADDEAHEEGEEAGETPVDWAHEGSADDETVAGGAPAQSEDPFDVNGENPLEKPPGAGAASDGGAQTGRRRGRKAPR
jgi:preprotein translocase subunit YajC